MKPTCICGATHPLSVQEGGVIQTKNLMDWHKKLRPEAWRQLWYEVHTINMTRVYACGHDVVRGEAITNIVLNLVV